MGLGKAGYGREAGVGYSIHLEATYVHMVREITSVELDVAVNTPLVDTFQLPLR